jgi:putative hemolysin
MNRRLRHWLLTGVLLGAPLAACGSDDDDPAPPEEANPASVFCVEQGGEVDIVDEADGQVGYCVLPDGTRVDEWEYFRAEAASAATTAAP